MIWECDCMRKMGFGFLRLPQNVDKSINYNVLNAMVDEYFNLGGTYFDTAYTYLNGLSEQAIKQSVVSRYPREAFILADKLPGWLVRKQEDNQRYFDEQLERCGVDYFDVYLIHWLNDANYKVAQKYHQFEFLSQLKKEGKVHKIGFSYHDSPELLDTILTQHPEVDYVQLQINYLDWNSPTLQAKQLYEVAMKHHKKIIVMEPVKGGSLVNVPDRVKEILSAKSDLSIASWAIRFASSLEEVKIVLSGMNTLAQMQNNMQEYECLNQQELILLENMADIIRENTAIPCTKCGYCLKNCPKHIPIPHYFEIYNDYSRNPSEDWKMEHLYFSLKEKEAAASSCIECRMCERNCPQKINITHFLKKVTNAFE